MGEKMTYTIIYKDRNNNSMGTFTFVSRRHDKNYAWVEFEREHATCDQEPIAMIPGHAVVYLPDCISPTDFE
jgi:hypothetical protein